MADDSGGRLTVEVIVRKRYVQCRTCKAVQPDGSWHLCPGPCAGARRHLGIIHKVRKVLWWQIETEGCTRCKNHFTWRRLPKV